MRECYGQMDHAVFEPRGMKWLAGRKALVEERCTQCHDLQTVTGAAKSRDGWQSTVERMIGKGAQLNDAEKAVVIDYLAEEFKKENGVDLHNDPLALQRLKEAAEKAKIELSNSQQTEINLPFITADISGPKHLQMTLTRATLESLTEDLDRKSVV